MATYKYAPVQLERTAILSSLHLSHNIITSTMHLKAFNFINVILAIKIKEATKFTTKANLFDEIQQNS